MKTLSTALFATALLGVRSAAFYAGYVVLSVVWASVSLAVAWPLPMKTRHAFAIGCWTRAVLWWLRATCGIRVRVRGLEHLPQTPCILLVKHQSTWETLWLQTLASPQAVLIKRELLRIPFWGWTFMMVRPIAIDRGNPRAALRQFIADGKDRLARGMHVTLFPEGTRLEAGVHGKFQRGGAALASATGVPVVVVAHNAGRCWPARRFLKQAGEIVAEISPAFETEGRKTSEINAVCEEWMIEAMRRVDAAS